MHSQHYSLITKINNRFSSTQLNTKNIFDLPAHQMPNADFTK